MHGIFTYIWLIFMVNVGKYTIHGCYGLIGCCQNPVAVGKSSRHFSERTRRFNFDDPLLQCLGRAQDIHIVFLNGFLFKKYTDVYLSIWYPPTHHAGKHIYILLSFYPTFVLVPFFRFPKKVPSLTSISIPWKINSWFT